MNVTIETVAAAMGVSIPTEVIFAHVQKVSNYTARGRAGVCLVQTSIASTGFYDHLLAQISILLAILKYIDLVLSTCDITLWPQSYPQTL